MHFANINQIIYSVVKTIKGITIVDIRLGISYISF